MSDSDGKEMENSLFRQWRAKRISDHGRGAGKKQYHYGFHYDIKGQAEHYWPLRFTPSPVDMHGGFSDTYEGCMATFSVEFEEEHRRLHEGWLLYGGTYHLRGWIMGRGWKF